VCLQLLQARFAADLEAAWAEYRDTYTRLAALEQVRRRGPGRRGVCTLQGPPFCSQECVLGEEGSGSRAVLQVYTCACMWWWCLAWTGRGWVYKQGQPVEIP
jgi:hypothetical protein